MSVSCPAEACTGVVRLRPYQQRAIDEFGRLVTSGRRRILLVAPTGAGKCVTRETLVWSRGLRRFGSLWGADLIEGPAGPAQVAGWYDDGRRDGFEVELECGITIDATPAHRVWVRTVTGSEGWKYVGELGPDDYVAVARGQADFGQTAIPIDEAYALGVLVADGTCDETRLQVDKQRPLLKRIAPVVSRWKSIVCAGGKDARISDRSDYHAVLVASGNYLGLFRERYGIAWDYSENRVVPPCVLTGTRDVVQAFLRGYFDGDGYSGNKVEVSTASVRLAEEVLQLLLGLGVYAAIRHKPTEALPAHIVSVRDIKAFDREVGLTNYGLNKDIAYRSLLSKPRNTNVDLVPGLGVLLRRAARLVPRRSRRPDAWRHIDAYYGNKRPSYGVLAELVDALPSSRERSELERLLTEHRAWSQVRSVRSSFRRRIDCEVSGQHAFVGNGVINHNTVIAGSIIEGAAAVGQHVLFLAHRRELINQSYRKLLDFGVSEAEVGVLMGNDPRRRPGAKVQVASIDTLRNRAKPRADLVFIDECHRALSRSYRDVAAHYPNAVHLGLTATPYRADGRGLGHAYEELVVVASLPELIEQGYLVEPRVFTVPREQLPDLTSVRVRAGDYDGKGLEDAVNRKALIGNIVEHWMQLARGKRTVAFAVSVEHSKQIARRFRDAGIPAEHLDGNTPTDERDAILARLGAGSTVVVSNVGVLCEGTDIPALKCAILARPTKSTGLYLQQAGRILRPWNDEGAIVLDHAGCAVEHGLPQDEREFSLEGKRQTGRRGPTEAPSKVCASCCAVVAVACRTCPSCGAEFPAPERVPEERKGALVSAEEAREEYLRDEWDKLNRTAVERGYKPGWVYYRFKEKFGRAPPSRNEGSRPNVAPQPSPESRERNPAWAALRHRIGMSSASGADSPGWDALKTRLFPHAPAQEGT